MNDASIKDQILAEITSNTDSELVLKIATYLAGRSLAGEQYQMYHYGTSLETAKKQVITTTRDIAGKTGLSNAMLERSIRQIKRTSFDSFDHLSRLVTSGETGSAGSYYMGTLRIQVAFEGNIRSPKLLTPLQAHSIVTHEVQHAGSAQSIGRCGLSMNGQGLQPNEGMTEYIAQLSTGSPNIVQLSGGAVDVRKGAVYRAPVLAMLALHRQFETRNNQHFATLFNANHGDVRNPKKLETALNEFYALDEAITKGIC
jgi:hypothetical protein